MSVRHIHAKPGEYIAVHRRHGSSGNDNDGCAYALGIGLLVVAIAALWKIIVCLAALAAVAWLVWTFRHAIWGGVCWLFRSSGNLIGACRKRIQNRGAAKGLPQSGNPYFKNTADYGKIRQHR